MRKTDGLAVALTKIKERYRVISNAYNSRTDELENFLKKIKSEKTKERSEIAKLMDQKFYSCNEVLIQLQSWLDDVQSLEVINGLEKKLNDLYHQSKEELTLIEKLQYLAKDFLKIQENHIILKDIDKELTTKSTLFKKSVNQTRRQTDEINNILFNKNKLMESLSEHI